MGHSRVYATPPGVRLCALADVAEGRARNFVLQIGADYFHGFVVHKQGTVYGYVDRCPHAGLPLAHKLDDYLTEKGDFIACHWHGALFTLAEGRCVGGPCVGQSLTAWPVTVTQNYICTA